LFLKFRAFWFDPFDALNRRRNGGFRNWALFWASLVNFLGLLIIVPFPSALFSSRVEIPHWDLYTAKKLLPVVTINIVGLVFNTLCLREVEATFFQVLI